MWTEQELLDDLASSQREVASLRSALEPFARLSLTRKAREADDLDTVETLMAHCRAAQKALAAD